ncbi:MAG: hypothetical protein KDK64_08370 [Chlamydiia bacterium]|nr:hypothetical protein [Chlamydiia bacterium]
MTQNEIDTLIEDTLTYLREQLPQKVKNVEVELPKPPPQPKIIKKAPSPPPEVKVEEKPLKPPVQKDWISLQPPTVPKGDGTQSMRKILKDLDPDLYLHESIPSDHHAKRIKEAWKEKRDTPAIPILYQGQKYRSFVMNIAKAIDLLYGSCRIVEIEPQKKWDLFLESENLKLIIAPDSLLFQSKELLPFYQENPQQKTRKLGKVPLLLLPDLSLYFKDPYLKRALWNVIKNALTKEA